ncbi:TetR/AcrR family transcriptional regulator C-terminal domain-containing protein [Streptomyces globisporus]|uniref:TetR/AcrR family transcriptional regulator C-terminal domain-containing protein n=1 Tax=Streptomyces globisporus TaxID=1908 RepID=UPI0037A530CC
MTKNQASGRRGSRLDPATVVRAALELLDEKGLDALSLRAVADRLGVRMNTVVWHVKTKTRLLELMADAITGEIALGDLPDPPEERCRELARRYRLALLGRRDGAALVAGTYSVESHTLRYAEALVGALLEGGAEERRAAWTAWSIVYLALGLVQEEQAAQAQALDERLSEAISEASYPALHRVWAYFDAHSFDDRFEYALDALLSGRTPADGAVGE